MHQVLQLTLSRRWFDLIASGEKKEEYREVKPYWISRFVQVYGAPHSFEDYNFMHKGFKHSMQEPVYYKIVRFRNGYQKDSPEIELEVLNIDIDYGKEKWGAEYGKPYFVIKLGEILSIKNYN